MPTEPGDSWFSPKCIEVQRGAVTAGGRALDGLGAWCRLPTPLKLRIPAVSTAVRRWGLSFIVERETAQITS